MWNAINERATAKGSVLVAIDSSSPDLSVEQIQAAMRRGRAERAEAFASAGSLTFRWLARLFGRRQPGTVNIARPVGAAG